MVPDKIKDLRKMSYLPLNIPEDFMGTKIALLEEKYGIKATGIYFKLLGLITAAKEKKVYYNEIIEMNIFKNIEKDILKDIINSLFICNSETNEIKSPKVQETLRQIKKKTKKGLKLNKIKKTAL